MAKTNTERQADFREKMRQAGKQALQVWVTPRQARQIQALLAGQPPVPSQVAKRPASPPAPLLVTEPGRRVVLPAIPAKTPASIARDLQQEAKILRSKRAQIDKLEKDAVAIERRFRKTVEECKRL